MSDPSDPKISINATISTYIIRDGADANVTTLYMTHEEPKGALKSTIGEMIRVWVVQEIADALTPDLPLPLINLVTGYTISSSESVPIICP